MTKFFKESLSRLFSTGFIALFIYTSATASVIRQTHAQAANTNPQQIQLDLYTVYQCLDEDIQDEAACSALETWTANLANLDLSQPLELSLTATDNDNRQIVTLSDIFNMLDESTNFNLTDWADQLTLSLDANAMSFLRLEIYDFYQATNPVAFQFISYQLNEQTKYALQAKVKIYTDQELEEHVYSGQEEIFSYVAGDLSTQLQNYSGTNLQEIGVSVKNGEALLILNADQEVDTLTITTHNLAAATPYIANFTAIGDTAQIVDEQGNLLATSYYPEDASLWITVEDYNDLIDLTSGEKGMGSFAYNVTTSDNIVNLQTLIEDPDTGEYNYDFDYIETTTAGGDGDTVQIDLVQLDRTQFAPQGAVNLIKYIAANALLEDSDPDVDLLDLDAVELTVALGENITASVSYDQQEQQPVLALGDDTAAAILMLSGSLDESLRALNLPESNLQITGSLSSVNYDIEVEVDASGEVSTYTSVTTSEVIDPDTQAAIIADLITTGGDITITTREGEVAVLTVTDEQTAQKRLYYFAAKAGQSLTTTADILTVAELTRNIIAVAPADINSVYVGLSDGMQELESISTLAENGQVKTVSYNALTVSTDSEALKELLPAVASQTPAADSISIHATDSSDETQTLSIFGITSPSTDVFATVKQAVSEDSTAIVQLLSLESVSGKMRTAQATDSVVSATITAVGQFDDDQLTLSILGSDFSINIKNGAVYAVIFTASTTREQVEAAIAGSQGQFMVYFGSTYMLAKDGKLHELSTPTNDSPADTSDPNDRHASSRNVPNNARPQGCDASIPVGVADLFQIDRRGDHTTLYFTPVRDNTDRYHVIFGYAEGDERFSGIALQVTSEQNNGVLALDIANLDPRQPYSFKVAPVHNCAVGSWSNWLTAGATSTSRTTHTYRYGSKTNSNAAYQPASQTSTANAAKNSVSSKSAGQTRTMQMVTASYKSVQRKSK